MTQNERHYYDGKYNKILQKSCTNLKDLVKRKVEESSARREDTCWEDINEEIFKVSSYP